MRHAGVVVPIGIAVALDLTTDDRPITAEPSGDLGLGMAQIKATHDFHPLVEAEPVTTATRPIQITRIGQTQNALTHQKLHRSSVTPPQPRRGRRHAHLPGSRYQRSPLTHPVEQLPPRLFRMRITTRHDNLPKSTDVVLTV